MGGRRTGGKDGKRDTESDPDRKKKERKTFGNRCKQGYTEIKSGTEG